MSTGACQCHSLTGTAWCDRYSRAVTLIPHWGTDGKSLERPQERGDVCPHHTSTWFRKSVTMMKMILGTMFITIHYMNVLQLIINEHMCDHGFKKLAVGR